MDASEYIAAFLELTVPPEYKCTLFFAIKKLKNNADILI
jgi:hypothetical protein